MDDENDVGVIYNALDRPVEIRAVGRYFTFPANKVKVMSAGLAGWISGHRLQDGLVSLPPSFAEPENRSTAEGKRMMAERKKEGIQNRINHLKGIKSNLLVSLKKDLDMANIKADPREFASDGEIDAIKELAGFQAKQQDQRQKKIDEINELEKQITEN